MNRYASPSGEDLLVFNPSQLSGLQTSLDGAESVRLSLQGKLAAHHLRDGDVLITIRNRPLKASVVPNLGQANAVAGQNVAVFRPTSDKIVPTFLAGLLRSRYGQNLLEPYLSKFSTVSQVSLTDLRELKIPLPTLEVQNTLAKFMLEAERAERADLERIQQRRELVEATLAQTLGGR